MLVCTYWRDEILRITCARDPLLMSNMPELSLTMPTCLFHMLSLHDKIRLSDMARDPNELISKLKPLYRVLWPDIVKGIGKKSKLIDLADVRSYFHSSFHFEPFRYHIQLHYMSIEEYWSDNTHSVACARWNRRLECTCGKILAHVLQTRTLYDMILTEVIEYRTLLHTIIT